MKIIIAGGGESGEELAKSLIAEKHEVVIIEHDPGRAEELAEKLDCLVINDNAAHPRVLRDSGIEEADLLIALTGNDRDNVLVSLIAKHLGVKDIIAKIDDPAFNDVLIAMGINKIVNPGRLLTAQILSMIKGIDLLNISMIMRGNIRFYNIIIPEKFSGKRLGELPVDWKKTHPILVYRGEEALLPDKDLILEERDMLLLAVKPEYMDKLIEIVEG